MKRLSFVAVLCLTAALTSCQKEYTCMCTDDQNQKNEFVLNEKDRNDAQAACNVYAANYDEDCVLK